MKQKTLNKKGFQIIEIPSLLIVLLVLAIVISLSGTILSNVRQTSSMTSTSTRFYTNSTITGLLNTAVDFTPSDILYDGTGQTYLVASSCTGAKIASGLTDIVENYTLSGCTLTLTNVEYNNTKLKVNFTYTHNVYLKNYNITTDGLSSTEDFSGWQSTFVVIMAAAVVIGIVSRYLFFGGA